MYPIFISRLIYGRYLYQKGLVSWESIKKANMRKLIAELAGSEEIPERLLDCISNNNTIFFLLWKMIDSLRSAVFAR